MRHPTQEIFRPSGHTDLSGILLSIDLIRRMHFVDYEDKRKKPMKEFTDGRVILRFHEKGVSVFTPIDLPWATPDFPLQMYYIAQILSLHELQNLYFDLFQEELETHLYPSDLPSGA